MSKRILIGEITTAHGIKGYVKVRSYAEDETLLEHVGVHNAEVGGKPVRITLKNGVKGDWVAEVHGVTDRNEAETLRGTKLYLDRDVFPDTDAGEYYVEDLKGLKVVDKDGKEIGTVLDVDNFGAGDIIDIKPPSGPSFYIPFTDDIVLDVDFDTGTVTVELPEMA